MSPRIGGGGVGGQHGSTHQDGGADEISIASLSGTPAALTTHAAILDAHTKNEYEVIRTAVYHSARNFGPNSLALTADRLYAMLFIVARDMTVDRIAIDIQVAAGGTTIRLGIYSVGTNMAPGTLVLDCGAVDTGATGVKAATINKALTKGIYYLAFVSDGTPEVNGRSASDVKSPLGASGTSFTASKNGWYADDPAPSAYHAALPDPFPSATIAIPEYAICLRPSSLD